MRWDVGNVAVKEMVPAGKRDTWKEHLCLVESREARPTRVMSHACGGQRDILGAVISELRL